MPTLLLSLGHPSISQHQGQGPARKMLPLSQFYRRCTQNSEKASHLPKVTQPANKWQSQEFKVSLCDTRLPPTEIGQACRGGDEKGTAPCCRPPWRPWPSPTPRACDRWIRPPHRAGCPHSGRRSEEGEGQGGSGPRPPPPKHFAHWDICHLGPF